jgi:hypothetical protein
MLFDLLWAWIRNCRNRQPGWWCWGISARTLRAPQGSWKALDLRCLSMVIRDVDWLSSRKSSPLPSTTGRGTGPVPDGGVAPQPLLTPQHQIQWPWMSRLKPGVMSRHFLHCIPPGTFFLLEGATLSWSNNYFPHDLSLAQILRTTGGLYTATFGRFFLEVHPT